MTDGKISAYRRLLVPALSTLAMTATLLFLGTWQVERLAWKRGLIAAIAAAETRPAIALPATPQPFTKIRVAGQFDPAATALYGAELREIRGYSVGGAHLLGLLRRDGMPPILVDRGWVPVPAPPIESGPASIDGYIRPAERPGLFSPADDLAARRFFTLDPQAIGAAIGAADVAPFILVALGAVPAQGYPAPATTLPRPTNNHLAYAATWYGLAAILLVIFALHVRKVLRA